MPFNGTGTYTPAAAPAFPAVAGQPISSTYFNTVINDIATAMSNMITRDGQGKASAAINWNGQNLTNVADFSITGNATIGGTLAVTGTVTFTGTFNTGVVVASGGLSHLVQCGFSSAAIGQVGYHMYNGGSVVEWFTYQPVHATGDDYRIGSVLGGVITDRLTLSAAGGLSVASLGLTTPLAAVCGGTGTTTNTGTGSNVLSASPALTGVPTAPTAAAGTSTTQLATTAFVEGEKAPNLQDVASAATVTPTFLNDMVRITAQAAGLTLANPTGATIEGWGIVIRIKDNGTPRAIAYGTQYRALGVTLPVTTVANKTLYLGMIFNNSDTKWDVVSVAQEA